MVFRNYFVLCFSVSLAVGGIVACTTTDSQRAELSDTQQKILKERQVEREIGRNMAARLVGFYGIYENPEAFKYVNMVGRLIADNSDAPERPMRFDILNTDVINAYASPGGYILITKGALKTLNSESELASILGHEVSHVVNQHVLNAIQGKSVKKEEAEKAKNNLPPDPYNEVRKPPEPPVSAVGSILTQALLGASAASFVKAVDMGMQVVLSEGIDPKLEFEADMDGVVYALRAGYEPKAMLRYFSRIEKSLQKTPTNSEIESETGVEKTHPKFKERRQKISDAMESAGLIDRQGAQGKERFDKIKATIK